MTLPRDAYINPDRVTKAHVSKIPSGMLDPGKAAADNK